jgi:hypothetical protein
MGGASGALLTGGASVFEWRSWINLLNSFLREKTSFDFEFWEQREEETLQLRNWLRQDPPERIMLLAGPRGDGKASLVITKYL